jgi:hypothetical protein
VISRQTAQHCPGGVCEVRAPLRISAAQIGILALFFAVLVGTGNLLLNDPRDLHFLTKQTAIQAPGSPDAPAPAQSSADCTPPEWAVKMGHAEMWKLHHNCK